MHKNRTILLLQHTEERSWRMSLQSTLDSMDGLSDVASPSSSQQQQVFVTTTRVKNQHLSLAQMRGVVQIFNHYFPKTPGKRMNKDEKRRRWISYKSKIYQEYKRIITGKFASEKALVKRYSEPLAFLKYKLKRATNLNVSDLSQVDQDYFHEIGGIDDINELIKQTYNIDSVEKISQNFQINSAGTKRRRILNESIDAEVNSDGNHNVRHQSVDHQVRHPLGAANVENVSQIPAELLPPFVQVPKIEDEAKLSEALVKLNEKMDIFEREQLDKKKIEVYEITKQKLLALKNCLEAQILNDPHLIGCMPGIEDQETLAFDCWLNKYKHVIRQDPAINNKLELFIDQLTMMQTDRAEWSTFLAKWKLNRILYKDEFKIIWAKVKAELNIEEDAAENSKEEL